MGKSLMVVDANIISHALAPNQTAVYTSMFRRLETDYIFIITGYTQYELLCSSSKENQAKIHEFIDNEMIRFGLSQPLMDFSARMHNLYKLHASTAGRNITVGDITNAALAIIKKCSLITIDNNDYPRPFFVDLARERLQYTSRNHREITDTAYILKPDLVNVQECFKNLDV